MKPEDLLDKVCDRESFIAFAMALAAERQQAAQIEAENPDIYVLDGALGWKNGCIAQFIENGLAHFDPDDDGRVIETPSWKDIAMFLYCGKIIE